jgi:hypothetical protein
MIQLGAYGLCRPSLDAVGLFHVAITLVLLRLLAPTLSAGETWDGGGANNNWTTDLNWNPDRFGRDNAPPNDGSDDIIMAGTTKLSNQVDVDWDINSLTFNNTAGAFNINGFSPST